MFTFYQMDNQDWTPVTIKKNSSNGGNGSSSNGSSSLVPRQAIPGSAALRKLETTDFGKVKQLSVESRNEIVQKRVALGKNQVQLNQDCRFPVNTIRDFENGRLCPTGAQLNMLNRILRSAIKFDK